MMAEGQQEPQRFLHRLRSVGLEAQSPDSIYYTSGSFMNKHLLSTYDVLSNVLGIYFLLMWSLYSPEESDKNCENK